MNEDNVTNVVKKWNLISGYENQDILKSFLVYHANIPKNYSTDTEKKLKAISGIIESNVRLKETLIEFNEVFVKKLGAVLGFDFDDMSKRANRSLFHESDIARKINEWLCASAKKDWNPFEQTEKMISESFSDTEEKKDVEQRKKYSSFCYSKDAVDVFKNEVRDWNKNKEFLKSGAIKFFLLELIFVKEKMFSENSSNIPKSLGALIKDIKIIQSETSRKIYEKKMEEIGDFFDEKGCDDFKSTREAINDLQCKEAACSIITSVLLEMKSILAKVSKVFLDKSKENAFTPNEGDIFFHTSRRKNINKLIETAKSAEKSLACYFYYDSLAGAIEGFTESVGGKSIGGKDVGKSSVTENEKFNPLDKEKTSLWIEKTILKSSKKSNDFFNDLMCKLKNKEIDAYSIIESLMSLESVDIVLKKQKPIKLEVEEVLKKTKP